MLPVTFLVQYKLFFFSWGRCATKKMKKVPICNNCPRRTGFDANGIAHLHCFECSKKFCQSCQTKKLEGNHKRCQSCFESWRNSTCSKCHVRPKNEGFSFCGTCYLHWKEQRKGGKCTGCGQPTGLAQNGTPYELCVQCRFQDE